MDQQFVAQLEQTLGAIVQPAGNLKDATKALQSQFYTQAAALPALIHILQNSTNDGIKQLAGVEARKQVAKHWGSLDAATQSSIKQSLLNSAFSEEKDAIRHANARVIASIGSEELDEKKWPELIPNLLQAACDSNPKIRETAVFIILSLLESFNANLSLHIDDFLNLFAQTINDSASLETRSLSAQALSFVSSLIEEEGDINPQYAAKFASLIPSVVQVLDATIKENDTTNTKLIFNCLNDFLLLDSQLTGNSIADLVKLALQIAVNVDVDEDIRVFAVQFVTSALVYRKSKINQAKLGPEITLAALKVASEEIDVEDELTNEDEAGENEENTPALTAIRLISNASGELSPSQVGVPIIEHLQTMLSSSNPFERRGILLAISVLVSGSPDYTLSQFDKIIPATITGLKDSEPVVQLAALKCIVQLSTNLQEEVARYHEQYLPLVIDIIDSAKHVVIYKYATLALDGLLEFIAHNDIIKYLEPLMNKLFQMLDTQQSPKLRAAIVSAIGSCAFAAGSGFVPYFKTSVQYLQQFIQNVSQVEGLSEDEIELKALTFENISTMGRAVKSATFAEVAEPLVNAAYEAIKTDSARLRESGYAFIANMAKVYGKEFAPFLQTILPEIFKTLEQEEYQFNFDGDEDFLEGIEDLDEEELQSKFTVNTGIAYEKEVAAAALSELAIASREHFLEYVEPSLKVLTEQVNESYGLKETALHSMWAIVKAVLLTANLKEGEYPKGIPSGSYVDASALAVIQSVREVSLNNVIEEVETSMVISVFQDVAEMLRLFGPIIIMDNGNSTQLDQLCREVLAVLKGEHACQTIHFEEDIPQDEDLDASETEATLLDVALDVYVVLAANLVGGFAQVFTAAKPVILQLCQSKSKNKRSFAVGALSEMALGMREENPFIQELLEALIISLTSDKSLEVRCNASYGIGLLIEYSSFDVSAVYTPVLKSLYEILSVADEKNLVSEDDEATKEIVDRTFSNVCGCVARMTLKHQNLVPLEHTLPALLNHLPFNTAFEEYDPIFKLFLKLFQEQNSIIVKEAPKVIEIFGTVFEKEAERIELETNSTLGREENLEKRKQFQTEEIKQQVIELLKHLNQQFNGAVAQNPVLAQVIA